MRRSVRPIYEHVNVQCSRFARQFRNPQAIEIISCWDREYLARARGRTEILRNPRYKNSARKIGEKMFACRKPAYSDRHQEFAASPKSSDGDGKGTCAKKNRTGLVIGYRQR